MVMATETERETEPIPSVKDLASSEPAARRKNLQSIISHLETRSSSHYLTHTQALQLWRGFHVSLYMHDSKNQLSVQSLIATLASTFKIIRRKDIELRSESTEVPETSKASVKSNGTTKNALSKSQEIDEDGDEFTGFDDNEDSAVPATTQIPSSWLSTYTAAFWETMAREWSGVDQWRMNKYLLLIRFALREILEIGLGAHFGLETIANNNDDDASLQTASKKRKATEEVEDSEKPTSASSSNKKGAKKAKKNSSITTDTKTQSQPQSSTSSSSPTPFPNPDPQTSSSLLSLLSTWPLSPRSRKVSDGLRLHLLDIYLDELFTSFDSVNTTAQSITISNKKKQLKSEEVKKVLEETYLEPIRSMAKDGLAKHVRVKAKEVLVEFGERVGELEI